MRKSFSDKQRLEIFRNAGGICHICGGKINGAKEAWDVEHMVALGMGGTNEDDNLAPAHVKCHKTKTKDDVQKIAKTKRVNLKHMGAKKKRPWPGTKTHKRKVDGTVVERD